jgi:spore maturation protein CgeB
MNKGPFRIAFFGSSLISAYWNGAATYYRGVIKALYDLGQRTTFYEPDAYERKEHRDIPDPPYAGSVIYPGEGEEGVRKALEEAGSSDVIVKASGVGVFDRLLEEAVLELKRPENLIVYWDVDAPATLDRVITDREDPFRSLIPAYDLILTYGGGAPVVEAYRSLGARKCTPIYNGLDPDTHHPVGPDRKFTCTLGLLANRMPDREERVKEFFFHPAQRLPGERFLLGGSGWEANIPDLENVRILGHVYTRDHNAFNCSPLAVLNVNRESMARYGFSPATRIFEAAGAGACIVTDAWEGMELFLEPEKECLVARNGEEVAGHLDALSSGRAREIGLAAMERVLSEHTYQHRAGEVIQVLSEAMGT